MLRRYFQKRKQNSTKRQKIQPLTAIQLPTAFVSRTVFQLVVPFLQWPERLICERVCKQWKDWLCPLKTQTQEQLLSCLHKHWYTMRVSLPRFQSPFVPTGYPYLLFSTHHSNVITGDHVCARALIVPGSAKGYKETIRRNLEHATRLCSIDHQSTYSVTSFSVCIREKGVLLLCLPIHYDTCWTPLNVLQSVNMVVHTKLPTMLMQSCGVQYMAQPDLRDALLSFSCPCYIRYLAMCGFFWPHTRREFKTIDCNDY